MPRVGSDVLPHMLSSTSVAGGGTLGGVGLLLTWWVLELPVDTRHCSSRPSPRIPTGGGGTGPALAHLSSGFSF